MMSSHLVASRTASGHAAHHPNRRWQNGTNPHDVGYVATTHEADHED
jgi:hypothetical protein